MLKKLKKSIVESLLSEMIHRGSLLWFSASALTASSNPLLISNPENYDGERPEIRLDCIVGPLTERVGFWHIYIKLRTTMQDPIESIVFIVKYLNLHLYSS